MPIINHLDTARPPKAGIEALIFRGNLGVGSERPSAQLRLDEEYVPYRTFLDEG